MIVNRVDLIHVSWSRRRRASIRKLTELATVLLGCAWVGCAAEEEPCAPLGVCDIRQRECQLAVASAMACLRGGSAMACLRGGSAVVPAVELITQEQFRMRTAHEPNPDDAAMRGAWTRGLALFGLSAPAVDSQQVRMQLDSETAAAYLPEESTVVVIDRGEPMRSATAVVLLGHEMIHAMQDAEFGLQGLFEAAQTSFDRQLALRALIEGEATHYHTLAFAQLEGWQPTERYLSEYYRGFQSDALEEAESDALPLDLAILRFPYAFGGAFASAVWLARGPEGLRAMFEEPPRTTREIMFDPASFDLDAERQTVEASSTPVLPEGFEPAAFAHLGAWIARMYSAAMGVPVNLRFAASRALAADVLSVAHNAESNQTVATWRIRLLPPADMNSWPPGLPPIQTWSDASGRDVYSVAQSPGSAIDPRALTWRELPPESMPQAGDMDTAMEAPEMQLDCLAAQFTAQRLVQGSRAP